MPRIIILKHRCNPFVLFFKFDGLVWEDVVADYTEVAGIGIGCGGDFNLELIAGQKTF